MIALWTIAALILMVIANFSQMNGMEQIITIIGGITLAFGALCVVVAYLTGNLVAVAAAVVAITAGVALVGTALASSMKRSASGESVGGRGAGRAMPTAYSAAALDGQPWCMMFAQWCFAQAMAAGLLPIRTTSCGTLMRSAIKWDLWKTRDYRPGDVVIFDFSGKRAVTEHVGIVESVTKTGVITIEGNTSTAGSQSNGGMVCRKNRANSLIVGAVRPQYKEDTRIGAFPPFFDFSLGSCCYLVSLLGAGADR